MVGFLRGRRRSQTEEKRKTEATRTTTKRTTEPSSSSSLSEKYARVLEKYERLEEYLSAVEKGGTTFELFKERDEELESLKTV